jgi:GNAT superfamily N-acetyltransferase
MVEVAFRDYARGIGRERPGPYEWLEPRLAAGEIAVAEANARIIGMVALSRDAEAESLTVDLLAVDPSAQGCGVGRLLLSHSESLARAGGARTLRLHTVAKYERLIRLYERAGYEVTHYGPRPKGDDGHERAFMRKTLDKERMTQ